LDGEKNLKKRSKVKDFEFPKPDNSKDPKNFKTIKGECECDEPNAELYEF
jgi:hypothetical protein